MKLFHKTLSYGVVTALTFAAFSSIASAEGNQKKEKGKKTSDISFYVLRADNGDVDVAPVFTKVSKEDLKKLGFDSDDLKKARELEQDWATYGKPILGFVSSIDAAPTSDKKPTTKNLKDGKAMAKGWVTQSEKNLEAFQRRVEAFKNKMAAKGISSIMVLRGTKYEISDSFRYSMMIKGIKGPFADLHATAHEFLSGTKTKAQAIEASKASRDLIAQGVQKVMDHKLAVRKVLDLNMKGLTHEEETLPAAPVSKDEPK